MDYRLNHKINSPTILVVSSGQEKLAPNSAVVASLNQVYISVLEAPRIISWVQQHQPDLIVVDLSRSQIIDLQFVTALRLDWLTRNIPILIVANPFSLQSFKGLDYDACLIEPYSLKELEQTICTLMFIPACKPGYLAV